MVGRHFIFCVFLIICEKYGGTAVACNEGEITTEDCSRYQCVSNTFVQLEDVVSAECCFLNYGPRCKEAYPRSSLCASNGNRKTEGCEVYDCVDHEWVRAPVLPPTTEECCTANYHPNCEELFSKIPKPECVQDEVNGCIYRECFSGILGNLRRAVISEVCCYTDSIDTSAHGHEQCFLRFPHLYTKEHSPTLSASILDVKPTVRAYLQQRATTSTLQFKCEFHRLSRALYYTTTWYVDGRSFYALRPVKWMDDSFDYHTNAALTEDMLKDNGIQKAGFELSCQVSVQDTQSSPKTSSQTSDKKFVGAKIDAWSKYVIKEGETRRLYVYLTVPFGCSNLGAGQPCLFSAEVETLKAPSECEPAIVVENSCGMKPITAESWFTGSYFTFAGRITSVYGEMSKTTQLKIKTPKSSPYLSSFWLDYTIGYIEINVVKKTKLIEHKYCSATNDPYLHTFGGTWFYLGVTGAYTFYKDDGRNIEVQIETEQCGSAFCTCGIAVRAGKTVYEISTCSVNVWTIGYTACDDGTDILNIRRYYTEYIIALPSGNSISVSLSTGSRSFMNVRMFPTVEDLGKSRGLCGVLHSEHLIKRDGTITSSRETFAESWRVDDGLSLFNPDYVQTSLSSFKSVYQYCSCAVTDTDTRKKITTCSSSGASETCKTPPFYQKVSPKDCNISTRKKRMAEPRLKRSKKVTAPVESWLNGWNLTAATRYCDEKFAKSNSVSRLKHVPGVNETEMKRECVEDIKNSGTTEFSYMAVASVRTAALREAMVNRNLSKPNSDNSSAPNITDIVTRKTCMRDCSGRGTCSEGKCFCNAGYGGRDCSLNKATPPVLYEVADGGQCDLATKDCIYVSAIGDIFGGDGSSRCRVQKNKVTSDGIVESGVETTVVAVAESISEVECFLPDADHEDVVTTYTVSVSHNGNNFSNQLTFFVYDSTCVTVNHSTRKWSLKSGFCVHKGYCFQTGQRAGYDGCMICESSDGSTFWTQFKDIVCPAKTTSVSATVGNFASQQAIMISLTTVMFLQSKAIVF